MSVKVIRWVLAHEPLEQQFRDAGQTLYEKFDSYFSPNLLNNIKKS